LARTYRRGAPLSEAVCPLIQDESAQIIGEPTLFVIAKRGYGYAGEGNPRAVFDLDLHPQSSYDGVGLPSG
jgi:hypothetical protein